MRMFSLSVLLAFMGGSAVQAQTYPGYYYPSNYYRIQPVQASRYYYPMTAYPYRTPYANYYYTPSRGYATPYSPTSYPRSGGTAFTAQPSTVVIQEEPIRPEAIDSLPVETVPPVEGPPAPERDRGNVTRLWSSFSEWMSTPEIPGGDCASGFCGAPPRRDTFWVSANYVAMFLRPMSLNGPLVTTGSVFDNPSGALGAPSTAVLYGNEKVDYNLASGGSLSGGIFLDGGCRYSIEGSVFFVVPNRSNASFGSDGNGDPLIARPVFATDLGREAVFFNALPGTIAGDINLTFRSNIGGAEINGRYYIPCGKHIRTDLLFGARYVRLAEEMQIQESIRGINGTTFPFNGQDYTSLTNHDSFDTTNQFLGPQIGGRVMYEHSWLNLSLFAKLGLGATMQQVSIDGATTFSGPTGSLTAAGGVLALPSNIGTYHRTVFGILPEFGFNVGFNITDHLRLQMGYSALLWNRVVRPGTSFDRSVNTGLAPSSQNFGTVTGAIAPVFRFHDETFWAQSLNLGLEFHY